MAKNALKFPPWLEKILKWLKMHLNCSPWLEKFLKFTGLKWLKMHLNCPPRLETNLKFTKSLLYYHHSSINPIWGGLFIPPISGGGVNLPPLSKIRKNYQKGVKFCTIIEQP